MKIYLLIPQCPPNPHLFPVWIDTWKRAGHTIVDDIKECDVVFMDMHTRIAKYSQDDIDKTWDLKKAVVTFDEFDMGGMSDIDWPYLKEWQHYNIFSYIKSCNPLNAHFCRLLNKNSKYPENVYPYEKGIIYEELLLTPDELFDRPFDICFIANTAPQREHIARAILDDSRLRCYVRLGEPKIPFDEFVNQHKKAKLFISASGGGYTDERKQRLFSIAGMIIEKTNQLVPYEFTDGINCIKISEYPTKQELDNIVDIVNDKDRLYDIYKSGYEFMKTWYTNEAMANYILQKLKENNII